MSFYDDASWLLVPSGIEEDIVFAQKPISGLGDLTFTRASDATYTDSTGVVRRSPYNLVQDSEMFSTANWPKLAASLTANTTTSPSGTLTADTFSGDGTSSPHYIYAVNSVINGVSYTASIYAKKNTNNFIQLQGFSSTFGTNVWANFDLNSGVVGSVGSSTTASIQSIGNGWYRCVITGVATATISNPSILFNIVSSATALRNEINTLSTSIFIWGAQLVEGTSALDYFPTTDRLNVPRIDFRNADGTLSSCGRLLLEPQRTNSIRNSSMVGAVAGSPGTLPTNWAVTNLSGLTQTIVGTGVENGLPYFDIRYNGTATSTSSIDVRDEANTQIAAANGQSWTHTAYLRLVSAVVPPAFVQVGIYERTSTGIFVVGGFATAAITSTLQRFSINRTLSGGATVAFTQPLIQFSVTNGVTYDFTIRIAAPQMELGAYATTWVPTTTAAVTRLADVASKTGVSSLIGQTQGTLFIDFQYNQPTSDANGRLLQVYGTSDVTNSILPLINGIGANANQFQISTFSNGSFAIPISPSLATTVPFGRQKIAVAYNAGVYTIYRNGSLFASGTSPAPLSLTALELGSSTFVTRNLSNPVNQAALFPTRLDNATLAQLTTL